jgi:2'-5' RNA ligase superfamily protein
LPNEDPAAAQAAVTAIDITLEPDHTMIGHARAANAALRQNFPKGFSLDETHHPHISIFAGFVPTADLPKAYEAAAKVLASESYTSWKLTAFKYYYITLGPIGLAGIVVQPTPDLLRLQQKLIDAVGSMTVKTATAAAFYTTPEEPDIHPSVIDYIANFSEHAARDFNPHVTIGVGTAAFLDALLAKPFDNFGFSPAASAVFQFGDFGAARKRLKSFPAN